MKVIDADETLSPKRYRVRVFECAACGKLADTTRAHAITCSTACRVALHRHPERFEALKEVCAALKVRPAMVLEANAIKALRPDLVDKIVQGAIEIEDTREDVYREFLKLLREQLTRDARVEHAS